MFTLSASDTAKYELFANITKKFDSVTGRDAWRNFVLYIADAITKTSGYKHSSYVNRICAELTTESGSGSVLEVLIDFDDLTVEFIYTDAESEQDFMELCSVEDTDRIENILMKVQDIF